jgi:lipoprotein-anchoring transpeptidase ErfK/SrfK
VNTFRRFAAIVVLMAVTVAPAAARRKGGKEKPPPPKTPSPADVEAATRLQVFLDRANFSPGKLDGRYGDFTLKALALYRESRGEQQPPRPPNATPETPPDVSGIDLVSVGQVFIPYSITDADLRSVGPLPASVPEQAKLKWLPYRDLVEALAEKFHCDRKFLEQLNAGKPAALKAGDQIMVPNVEPFEIGAVKDFKPGSEIAAAAANDIPDDPTGAEPDPDHPQNSAEPPAAPTMSVKVDTKANMVSLLYANKIVAAYPVTIGSAQTASPIGDWKIKGFAKLPNFRYDEAMLKHGERSRNFHMLPPGPNSPVGVMWIALNKKGIGLHGTAEPDTIGRSASHGCIRLANWDIVRLAGKVKFGVPVSIH